MEQPKYQSKAVPSWSLPHANAAYVVSYRTDLSKKWEHLIAQNRYDLARKNYEMGEIESARSEQDYE